MLSPSPSSSPRVARFQQWCLKKWSAVVQSKLLTVRQAHEDGFRQSPVTLSCLILPTSFWWLIQLWGAPQGMSRQQICQFPGRGFLFYKNTAEVGIQDFSLSGVWGYYLSVFQDEVTYASSGFNFWVHKGPKSFRVSFYFRAISSSLSLALDLVRLRM